MKIFKHLFTALLLLCTAVATAHDFEVDGIYYNISSSANNAVKVTYRGNYYSSYDNEYTGSVVIPESVAYNGTTYSVTSIGSSAFSGCSGLTSITIPNSVTSIGNYAFYNCTGLTSITIPNSVTSIGNYAFENCYKLTSITIPNSVTSIGNYAFYGCSRLTSIVIESGNMYYDSRNNCNAIIETATNTLLAGCQNTMIPNGITSIGNYAFYGCSRLTSIVIPNSVTSIGNYAFENCFSLLTVYNFSNLTLSKGSSYNGYVANYAGKVYNAPNGFIDGDFIWYENEDGMTLAGYLGNATELAMPTDYNGNSVTSIGNYAFYECTGLTSIEIPNSVTSIGNSAFYKCTGLTSIVIPNSVTSIGNYVFNGCTSLKELRIEDGESTLSLGYNTYNSSDTGKGLFCDCPLEALYLGRNLSYNTGTSCGYSPFNNIKTLTSVTIGNGVTSIERNEFYGCSGLTCITISNSVTSIGSYAFNGCTSLKELRIEDGERTLSLGYNTYDSSYKGKGLFYDCPLETLYLGRNLSYNTGRYYGYSPFYNIKTLASVVIGNSVTSIGGSAFEGCTGLTSIVIPNSVTSIGNYAFYNCSGLTSITSLIPAESLFDINSHVFHNVDKTFCTLYVPVGTKETYASTKGWKDFVNIVEKDFTGIDEVKGEPTVDASQIGKVKTFYDLNGRVVENPASGVYIVNGKKVLVK